MKKNIKTVLYLRADLTSQKVISGGSVAHTLGVVKGLIRSGKNVVCAAFFMTEELKTLGAVDVKKLYIPSYMGGLWWRVLSVFSNIFFFWQIYPLTRRYAVDVIYQRYTLLNALGAVLSMIKRIPFILEYNGSEVWIDVHWGGGARWKKLVWLARFIEWFNLKRATCIVVVSQVLKDELLKRGVGAEKILVNPNGVDINDFEPVCLAIPRRDIRKTLGIEDMFVFGFVGTFSLWHGINVLKEMIPNLIAREANAHFLLIGDGPLREDLQRSLKQAGIEKQVMFTGMVPQGKAKEYLAACDAFLSPTQPNIDGSSFFGSPTKLFEYMSMAKPIIASDIEQLAQVLVSAIKVPSNEQDLFFGAAHDACAILVKPDDINGFVAAASAIIKMQEAERITMGLRAREQAKNRYTWDRHTASILSFVEERL